MVVASERLRPIRIDEEMRSSYLDYAMSVIVARALPDVRDGLKPVQRRVLYAMHEMGLGPGQPYRKSARIVGEVLGKYHPHGDAPVYEAMVRLAQDFSMRYPLIDGQGNFGSIDNDPPAAMRYTEARLAAIAQEMLADIEQETVDFTPNFDASFQEPTVLPARFANLLVNGASGIAVGMATNIPPHNLSEVCDAVCYLIDHPDATVDDLLSLVKGPDFPTGGLIRGMEGIRSAYSTGRGRIVLEARVVVEEAPKGGKRIVIKEIPYQLSKAALVERIAQLARDRKIEGIADVRDESDREGLRVVVELRREAQLEKVLNSLYKHTPMRTAFHVNMLALVDGVPRVITLKAALQQYIQFRCRVITRRSEFELRKARERAHILEGLQMALNSLDEVIQLIRQARDVEAARQELMSRFAMTSVQAQAILDMQLRRLAALERERILQEYQEVQKTIHKLEALLADPQQILNVVKEETRELQQKYGDPRRTAISAAEVVEFSREDLEPHQEVAVILTHRGYIKRLPIQVYRSRRRGAKGSKAMSTREEDGITQLVVADTHQLLLFFTSQGRVLPLKCYEIPADASRSSRGLPVVNLIPLKDKERVQALLALPQLDTHSCLLLVTRRGEVKRLSPGAVAGLRSSGLMVMDLEKGDELVAACLAPEGSEAILVTQKGRALRFLTSEVPLRSRHAGGVRAVRLASGDRVVGMDIVAPGQNLLLVSQRGFGKQTPLDDFPRYHRGGVGVRAFKVTDKTGLLASARVVRDFQELLLISARAQTIRLSLSEIPLRGRDAQGVILWKLGSEDQVIATAFVNGLN